MLLLNTSRQCGVQFMGCRIIVYCSSLRVSNAQHVSHSTALQSASTHLAIAAGEYTACHHGCQCPECLFLFVQAHNDEQVPCNAG